MSRQYMTVREYALYIKVSEKTVYRMIDSGSLAVERVGIRKIAIPVDMGQEGPTAAAEKEEESPAVADAGGESSDEEMAELQLSVDKLELQKKKQELEAELAEMRGSMVDVDEVKAFRAEQEALAEERVVLVGAVSEHAVRVANFGQCWTALVTQRDQLGETEGRQRKLADLIQQRVDLLQQEQDGLYAFRDVLIQLTDSLNRQWAKHAGVVSDKLSETRRWVTDRVGELDALTMKWLEASAKQKAGVLDEMVAWRREWFSQSASVVRVAVPKLKVDLPHVPAALIRMEEFRFPALPELVEPELESDVDGVEDAMEEGAEEGEGAEDEGDRDEK